MPKQVDIKPGDKFDYLTVLEEVERWVYPSGDTRRQFLMQCDCGSAPKKMLISNFKTGSTKSCGCYNKERTTTHGMNETRQYQCWADMKTRCDQPNNKFYDYYGGRGISYCDKWKTFEGFWEDMKDTYCDTLTIHRVDNDGNYCKENCVWATKRVQGHVRRKRKGGLYSVIGASTSEAKDKVSASIRLDGDTRLYLGCYETEEEVAEAYDMMSGILFGDRPNKTVSTRSAVAERVQHYFDNKDVILKPKGEDTWNATLTEQEAIEIWDLLKSKQFIQADIAAMYNVKPSVVSSISKGSAWVHVTKAPRVLREKMPFNIGKVFRFTNGPHAYWGIARTPKGERVQRRTFSVSKLGEDQARAAAEQARVDWINELTLLEAA